MLLAIVLAAALPQTPRAADLAGKSPTVMPIELRYALADRYLSRNLDSLIVDRDLDPHFAHDGKGIVYRQGPNDARAIKYLDLATGQVRTIVADADLAAHLSRARGKPVKPADLNLDDPDYDAPTGILTFSWGKRWTLTADGALSEATKGTEGLSPDGRFRIVSRDFNLVAIDIRSGRDVSLTKDGTRDQPYGRGISQLAEILEQDTEDPKLPVSVRWSPDSKRIMTWRLDTRGVERLSMTQQNPPGSLYPRSFHYIYPLAGAAKLPIATRMIIDVEHALRHRKATIVPVAMPPEELLYPADPDMGWLGDKGHAQWTARGYSSLVAYDIDPETGAARIVARESVKPIVTVTSSSLQPTPELGGVLDISERSGWAQLYLVRPDDPDGGIPLTRGAWEVLSVDHVDAPGKAILITGVGREADRNPYWRALYRVTLDGSQPRLLTPEPLDHDVQVSGDGRWAIDAMSSPTLPTRWVIRDTMDGHILSELGHSDATAMLATGYTMPEPFRGIAADGHTPLYGMIYRPADFDPARKYPVIDNVYTGPTTTQVPTFWGATVGSANSSVAQIGAIVVMIDGTGTSRRGQAFRLPAYQNLGEVGLDDHIAVIRQMAARYPYIDTSRVGVYGGSAGGYDAARFILRRPAFFKVAIASSGNHDLRLDKAWWPEVSMGNPDPSVWERNSNMSVARNLQGKLLLVHGDIDDNVPITESLRLENALIQADRNVDLVILPNTTHRVYQPYFWRKFRDYFVQNLLGETPPMSARIDFDIPPQPVSPPAATQ